MLIRWKCVSICCSVFQYACDPSDIRCGGPVCSDFDCCVFQCHAVCCMCSSLYMYMYAQFRRMCLCLCVRYDVTPYIRMCVCMSVQVCVYVSICVCMRACHSVHVCVSVPAHACVYVMIHLLGALILTCVRPSNISHGTQ